jgi:hypothetical protein
VASLIVIVLMVVTSVFCHELGADDRSKKIYSGYCASTSHTGEVMMHIGTNPQSSRPTTVPFGVQGVDKAEHIACFVDFAMTHWQRHDPHLGPTRLRTNTRIGGTWKLRGALDPKRPAPASGSVR